MDKYKALALDIDGTLLNETGELEESVITSVRRLVEEGVYVVLASGRMHPAILPFWRKLGLSTPIISYNGAKVSVPGEEPIFEENLDSGLSQEVIDFCKEYNYSMNAYFEDKLYVLRDNQYAKWYAEYFKIPVNILPEDGKWPGERPAKLLVIVGGEEELAKAYADLGSRFSGRSHMTTSSGRFVEILPEGVNKASGLARLAAFCSIDLNEWVAVGDGMNDLEMLNECGAGLVVENGCKELKSHITRVVPPLSKGGMEQILVDFFGISL